ncbi:MAG: GH36-type glycosyl hydrolase domain-containing protein [Candidatus Nanopelagicales bacterium]
MTTNRSLQSPGGISATATSTGALGRLECAGINLNLYPGTELEGGPAQIYLRKLGTQITSTPLLGPGAPGGLAPGAGIAVCGEWEGVRYQVELEAEQSAWRWVITLTNTGVDASFDLIHAQDVALSPYGMLRNNEYYVCQYLDSTALDHPDHGFALAVRNNLGVGDAHPWLVLASAGRAISYTTDALDFHGLSLRNATLSPGLTAPRLAGERLQHEHNLATLQEEQFGLRTGQRTVKAFCGLFVADHPGATCADDFPAVDAAIAAFGPAQPAPDAAVVAPARTLFSPARVFAARDLTATEIAERWPQREQGETLGGQTAAFFTPGGAHVVLRVKEREVLRPHGHLLRTGANLVPDEAQLTNTVYMNGHFATQLAEGHVGANKITTTARSYLGLQKANGLRIFVPGAGGWELLDQPSAWEVTPNSATWIYADGSRTVTVHQSAGVAEPVIDLSLESTDPGQFLLAWGIATTADEVGTGPAKYELDGASLRLLAAEGSGLAAMNLEFSGGEFSVADDAGLFADGQSRQQPFVLVETAELSRFDVRIRGGLLPAAELAAASPQVLRIAPADNADQYLASLLNGLDITTASDPDLQRLGTTVPWYIHNGLIHYLSPRGLEQFNGGGWGTRDISQGPVELLLGLGHHEPVRELLKIVFAAQNSLGGWPQAFGFFARNAFRHADDDPHGDVVFWPPLALAEYIVAAGDPGLLGVEVPFYRADGAAESGTLLEHIQRAIAYIDDRLIPGTRLERYGHGDWNDSLQPADKSMTDTLVSTWTVTLHYQMLTALVAALQLAGQAELAGQYSAAAELVLADFQNHLIVDDVLAGYASFADPAGPSYLVHPRDSRSGLTYSVLPIIHALINDMLTTEQAAAHKRILEQYLVAPDGARLFDVPPHYQGGPQVFFQRAESSTFFGREIGIMYTHAHLRYAEAMARYGDAEAFFLALRQAIPLGYESAVPNGRLRQSNCYFSSSDATFADRYQACAEYHRAMDGSIAVEGGWRVYSSGAGIAVRLIHECLLGIKRGVTTTVIDPVIPARLSGLTVGLNLAGRPVRVRYELTGNGCGVSQVHLNGKPLATTALHNPYRAPGVSVATADIAAGLTGVGDELTVFAG